MPSRIDYPHPLAAGAGQTIRLTNCRLCKENELVWEDLWIDSALGKIVNPQTTFYDRWSSEDITINMEGRIITPGFLDVQNNGAFNFDLSELPESGDMQDYYQGLRKMHIDLANTGVTSYVPTLVSMVPDVYHKVLPYLGPSGDSRNAFAGCESLGAHCEGPFISPRKNGCHSLDVLIHVDSSPTTITKCYGASNLASRKDANGKIHPPAVKMVTLAPEMPGALESISKLTENGIIPSVGHTQATFEEAQAAVSNGATMITHLFNAMNGLHHRNPGVFGLISAPADMPLFYKKEFALPRTSSGQPFFGIIADGLHVHPSCVRLAYCTHPEGFILVTDCVKSTGLPDGVYPFVNGQFVEKTGNYLVLKGTDTLAGSVVTLIDCVNNFLQWTGESIPNAIKAVTLTPAKMLGVEKAKGHLEPGADADLCVLSDDPKGNLKVEQVWKFGTKFFDASKKWTG